MQVPNASSHHRAKKSSSRVNLVCLGETYIVRSLNYRLLESKGELEADQAHQLLNHHQTSLKGIVLPENITDIERCWS